MTPWVLILVVTATATGVPTTTMQDFDSQEACESVKSEIKWRQTQDNLIALSKGIKPATTTKAQCVPK